MTTSESPETLSAERARLWVIERAPGNGTRVTLWWCGGAPDWSDKIEEAVKFGSRDSAERVVRSETDPKEKP